VHHAGDVHEMTLAQSDLTVLMMLAIWGLQDSHTSEEQWDTADY